MSHVKSIGEVHTEAIPCDIIMYSKTAIQAQEMVPTFQSRFIENIKLTILKRINIQVDSICGCCMMPGGKITIPCDKCKVRVIDFDGYKESLV